MFATWTSKRTGGTGRRRAALAALLLGLLALAVPAAAAAAAPAQDQLSAAIERLLDHPNLRGAAVGVEIRSLWNGDVIFTRNAAEPLITASNTKLVSTAAALVLLGDDYEFETAIFRCGELREGILSGDLVVKGGGDPCLSSRFFGQNPLEPLEALAGAAAAAGIVRVSGNLVLDDTIFDRELVAPGWPPDQLCYYYCAPVAGLSFMENVVHVSVHPGPSEGAAAWLSLFPPGAPFSFAGRIVTKGPKEKNTVHLERPDPEGLIQVRGETPRASSAWEGKVAVRFPPLYFGQMLRQCLAARGVQLDGDLVLADAAVNVQDAGCARLGAVRTPLREALFVTNKESHNNFAEHLFKLAGWKACGQGSFASGAAAVAALFRALGIEEEAGAFCAADGSGLSRENRYSAHAIVSLLAAVYASAHRDTFVRSLPVAGMDGSLKDRLTDEPYAKRVRAKTGWIRGVSALSGYVQAKSQEVFAFSFLFNGYKGMNADMKKLQDDVLRAVVDLK